jgi:FdhD protein
MNEKYIKHYDIIRYTNGDIERILDNIIIEDWVYLYLNDELFLQTPSTNKELQELVMGILYTHGLIDIHDNPYIKVIGNKAFVNLNRDIGLITQKDIIDCFTSKVDLKEDIEKITYESKVHPNMILSLVNDFQKLPSIYKDTGGSHCASIAKDRILLWSDDISRRSAVDKVIGKSLLHDIELNDKIIIVSGRISSEMLVKVIQARIPIVISISAPTDKAVDLGNNYGITIGGFARGKRINFYTHTYRIELNK